MHDWVNLTNFLGESIPNPSEKQLATALRELFESRDSEHPDAWIDCGSEGGALHNISIFYSGYAIYTRYADADMSEELEEIEIKNIDQTGGRKLWLDLIAGNAPTEA
ncbi:MAG: hypothetical protein AAF351_01360 [Pseudomonadota bacterium]